MKRLTSTTLPAIWRRQFTVRCKFSRGIRLQCDQRRFTTTTVESVHTAIQQQPQHSVIGSNDEGRMKKELQEKLRQMSESISVIPQQDFYSMMIHVTTFFKSQSEIHNQKFYHLYNQCLFEAIHTLNLYVSHRNSILKTENLSAEEAVDLFDRLMSLLMLVPPKEKNLVRLKVMHATSDTVGTLVKVLLFHRDDRMQRICEVYEMYIIRMFNLKIPIPFLRFFEAFGYSNQIDRCKQLYNYFKPHLLVLTGLSSDHTVASCRSCKAIAGNLTPPVINYKMFYQLLCVFAGHDETIVDEVFDILHKAVQKVHQHRLESQLKQIDQHVVHWYFHALASRVKSQDMIYYALARMAKYEGYFAMSISSYNCVMLAFKNLDQPQHVKLIFDQIMSSTVSSQVTSDTFTIALSSCKMDKGYNHELANHFIEALRTHNVQPNITLYTTLMLVYLDQNKMDLVEQIQDKVDVLQLKKDGHYRTAVLICKLSQLPEASRVQAGIQLLAEMKEIKETSIDSYNYVLNMAAIGSIDRTLEEDIDSCYHILEMIMEEGLLPNSVTMSSLIAINERELDSAPVFDEEQHRKNHQFADVFKSLIDQAFTSKKKMPDVTVLTALLHFYIRTRQYRDAIDILERARTENIILDLKAYTTAIRALTIVGRFQTAIELAEEVLQRNLSLDSIFFKEIMHLVVVSAESKTDTEIVLPTGRKYYDRLKEWRGTPIEINPKFTSLFEAHHHV